MTRRFNRFVTTLGFALALVPLIPGGAHANHPVLVEGELDFDGDGLIGAAEDVDNATDRVFGTLTAALDSLNGAANQNGSVLIVTSGRFPEQVVITGANGNVSIEAAPGVLANIDAVLAGNPDNATRQGLAGIVVNAPNTVHVTLTNLSVRNWAEGVQITGSSRVTIDNCRISNTRDYGIHVTGSAFVVIDGSTVAGAGFRSGAPPVDNTANPGIGIAFEETSMGSVSRTTVSGSLAAGVSNTTTGKSKKKAVRLLDVNVAGNSPDLVGVKSK